MLMGLKTNLKDYRSEAITCFRRQRNRCYNKKNPSFKYYGSKRIGIEYTRDEFISWYVEERSKFGIHIPTVGRIDHAKNYSLENIQLETKAQSSLERINRSGTTRPRKKIKIFKNNILVCVANSLLDSEKITGVSYSNISSICKGHLVSSKGYSFRFYDSYDLNYVITKKISRPSPKKIFIYKNGKFLSEAVSFTAAALLTEKSRNTVSRCCRFEYLTKDGYGFKYA